jgi:hypothetical protein
MCCFTPVSHSNFSTTKPILTWSKELVALLAGRPNDASYIDSLWDLEGKMDSANKCTPEKWAERKRNSCGHHVAVSMGLPCSGGSKVHLLSGRFNDPYCLSSGTYQKA